MAAYSLKEIGEVLLIDDERAIAITGAHTLTSYVRRGGGWQPISAASVGPFDRERADRARMHKRANEAWKDPTDPLWCA